MNEVPPVLEDLISRHFDEALPPGDHERLTAALIKDPAACRDFAATARLHTGLEALAPPQPAVKKPRFILWLFTAAAAVLVIGGGMALLNIGEQSHTRITLEDINGSPDGAPEKPKPHGLTRRVVKSPAAALAGESQALDVEKLLSRFYVNVTPHGLTVPQALVQLEEAIKFENILKRPELDGLSFMAAASLVPESMDPMVFASQQTPVSVRQYLQACSFYRRVVERTGGVQVYVQVFPGTPDEPLAAVEAREFKVPADFLISDGNEPPYPEGNASAARLARSLGILLKEDESATFSSNPSTLTVSARPSKLERLAQRLEPYLATRAVLQQVFVTSMYIKLPRVLLPEHFDEESGMILPDAQYQEFIAAVKHNKEACLITTPSLMVRAGQQSKIEMTKEVGSRRTENNTIGLTQGLLATLTGELIRVEGMVDFGVFDGLDMPGELRSLGLSNHGAPHPRHYQTEYELWLPDRSTALFVVDPPQAEGFVTLVCVTPTMIDRSE